MNDPIEILEARAAEVIARLDSLRAENRDLLAAVNRLNAEKRALEDKIAAARGRVEHLMQRLPETAS